MHTRIENLIKRLRFNFRYFGSPPWDTGISPPELVDFIQRHPSGRALDLGCGTGTNVLTLAQAGWNVTGIDFAWRAIRLARRRLHRAGVQADLRLGNVTDLSGVQGVFDLILDIGCYHNLRLEERSRYRGNLRRLGANGGTYMIYAHCKVEFMAPHHGIDAADEAEFGTDLLLVSREEGEERGRGPSVWLTYRFEGKD